MGTPDPAPPPPPPGGPPAGAPAGLLGRFVARLLDALIVGIPLSIVLSIAGLPAQTVGLGGVEAWTVSAVTALLWFAYYVGFESSSSGATLGKRIMRLRVVTADGSSPSPRAAAIRNVWLLFGLIPLVGGLVQLLAVIVIAVTIGSSPQNRGKHDEYADTGVVSH